MSISISNNPNHHTELLHFIWKHPYCSKRHFDAPHVFSGKHAEIHTDALYQCCKQVYESLYDVSAVHALGKQILEAGGETALRMAYHNLTNLSSIKDEPKLDIYRRLLHLNWVSLCSGLEYTVDVPLKGRR